MGRMIRLLDKPLRAFTIYAFVVLAASIPVYYLIVDSIWSREIDEHNQLMATATIKNLTKYSRDASIDSAVYIWNKIRPNTRINHVSGLRPDSIYNQYRENPYAEGDINRYQGLVRYFTIHGKSYAIAIETNMEESSETIAAITLAAFLLSALLITGFILLNRQISGKLWRPFHNTLRQMQQFDLNTQQKPVFAPTGIIEFEQLNREIQQLIAGNIEVYRQQKEFTENASHELQTPLAIVSSKIDLLLQDEMLSGRQSELIFDAGQALSRMARLTRNLLLLARLESNQYPETEVTDIAATLNNVVDSMADFAEGKNINLQLQNQATVKIETNAVLLEILLGNLLMNAVRHSSAGACVGITFNGHVLQIDNPGTDGLNPSGLFKRFGTVAKNTPGSGLGLAIVKQIGNRYNWPVQYSFANNRHCFTVIFGQNA